MQNKPSETGYISLKQKCGGQDLNKERKKLSSFLMNIMAANWTKNLPTFSNSLQVILILFIGWIDWRISIIKKTILLARDDEIFIGKNIALNLRNVEPTWGKISDNF